jgi:diguanylate cyclase (GGDEF)-like protein/PAS domain S-box-containing protein
MAIWSFAFGFLYLAENPYQYSFWNKISAFGWCTFEALVLYFIFILTERNFIRHWYGKLLVMLPAAVSLYMVIFLFGPDIATSNIVSSIFYIGNFTYNFTYLILGMLMIFSWGRRSNSRLQKKQANIITTCSLASFLLILMAQHILPMLCHIDLPHMGQLLSLIMLLGVNYAIMEYQFMSIPTSLITNELFNELTGLTFLVDLKGYITKANKQVNTLLDYKEDEILGSNIVNLIKHQDILQFMENCETVNKRVRFMDIDVLSKSGATIPFNISIIPLHTKSNLLRGLLFIGEDIRVTKRLQNEIVSHKLTNERLQNSEMLFRKILEIAPMAIVLISKSTGRGLYMNALAKELFGWKESELNGIDFSGSFINPEDRSYLREYFLTNKAVNKKEVQFKKSDNSSFIGLITITPSIYHEEEIALCCIIDMTEQKRVEEKLKKNNENINELNKELMAMNNILVNKSIKDGLTNLFNHQYINEVLEQKLQETMEAKEELCLMMIDIDHFKRINDKFGHLAGDKALATVADLIMKNTRESDYIGRYGGEEFIVILPRINIEAAAVIAENIRLSITNYEFGVDTLEVTISIGVAEYAGETANALINKADKLLYQAKSKGRIFH